MEQLAAGYLACVNPYNATMKALAKKYAKSTSLKALKSWSKQQASADGIFLTCVRGIAWPSSLDSDVHDVLKATSALQVTRIAESNAKSLYWYNYYVKIENKQALAGSSASNQLRGDLGLPPPPA